jgi:ABC-2 type transport system ATP-binding protein
VGGDLQRSAGEIVLQADVDDARRSAYVAQGLAEDVRAFVVGRDVITERSLGNILSATVRGQLSPEDEDGAAVRRLSIEPVSLQDLIAALGIHTLTSALTTENR